MHFVGKTPSVHDAKTGGTYSNHFDLKLFVGYLTMLPVSQTIHRRKEGW
jgi:hypothetical protein